MLAFFCGSCKVLILFFLLGRCVSRVGFFVYGRGIPTQMIHVFCVGAQVGPSRIRGRSSFDLEGVVVSRRECEASLTKWMPGFAGCSRLFVNHSG